MPANQPPAWFREWLASQGQPNATATAGAEVQPAPAAAEKEPRKVWVFDADGNRVQMTAAPSDRAIARGERLAAGTHVACEQPECTGIMRKERTTKIDGRRACRLHFRRGK